MNSSRLKQCVFCVPSIDDLLINVIFWFLLFSATPLLPSLGLVFKYLSNLCDTLPSSGLVVRSTDHSNAKYVDTHIFGITVTLIVIPYAS